MVVKDLMAKKCPGSDGIVLACDNIIKGAWLDIE
jgi:hypothetical protein